MLREPVTDSSNLHDRGEAPSRITFQEISGLLAGSGRLIGMVAGLSLLAAGASLAQPLLVSSVIEDVSRGQQVTTSVWLLVALVLISGTLSAFQIYLLQRLGESVVLSTRERLIRKLFRLPIQEYDFRRSGDLVSRLSSDSSLMRVALTQGLVAALSGVVTFLGALVAMALIDLVLLGVTLGVVTVAFVVVTLLGGSIQNSSTRVQHTIGNLTSAAERTLRSIRTVRAANATFREEDEVLEQAREARSAGLKLAKVAAIIAPISGLATQVSFLAVLGVGGYRVASGAMTLADLVAFILFLFMMVMPLSQAFEAFTAVSQALGGYRRVREILLIPDETVSDVPRNHAVSFEGAPRLSFEGVTFSYPSHLSGVVRDSPRHVLSNVSFDVLPGQRVAIVGPSGAGKSTILQLIERFYEPDQGGVLVDGVALPYLDREALRSRIGYVEQDAPALAGTIRSNLTLAAPHASDEQCMQVLRAVNLLTVVERSAQGLDSEVGQEGVTLSGGERQRLAIARALIAAPEILLLDESTSSLDSHNEQAMRAAIDAVARNRTLIVVAHRLSTVVDADNIVVLDRGEVVGTGSHTDLLETSNLYRSLAEHQLLVPGGSAHTHEGHTRPPCEEENRHGY